MERIAKLLFLYKAMLNFQDQTQRTNYKFVESYVKHYRKKHDDWIEHCVWFINEATDLHEKTLGRAL